MKREKKPCIHSLEMKLLVSFEFFLGSTIRSKSSSEEKQAMPPPKWEKMTVSEKNPNNLNGKVSSIHQNRKINFVLKHESRAGTLS